MWTYIVHFQYQIKSAKLLYFTTLQTTLFPMAKLWLCKYIISRCISKEKHMICMTIFLGQKPKNLDDHRIIGWNRPELFLKGWRWKIHRIRSEIYIIWQIYVSQTALISINTGLILIILISSECPLGSKEQNLEKSHKKRIAKLWIFFCFRTFRIDLVVSIRLFVCLAEAYNNSRWEYLIWSIPPTQNFE